MSSFFGRREFLKQGMGILATTLMPATAWSAMAPPKEHSRLLPFYNTHTGEHLEACYFYNGCYCEDTLEQVNRVMRDHRTGDVSPIDINLLDLLYVVRKKLNTAGTVHIISGYRSLKTNEMLRRTTKGVAKNSFHTQGKAIDIRIPGVKTSHLRKMCLKLKAGGVGYYPRSNFVHVDTGDVRSWWL